MRRRGFVLAVALLALPRPAIAQEAGGRRIGVLLPVLEGDPESRANVAAFRTALGQLGWREGANARIEFRWAGPERAKLAAAAKELVALQPDVIFTRTTAAAIAAVQATRTVPIVFVSVTDPVGDGLVQRLARPGGNATGFTNYEPSHVGKWLELLKQLDPRVTRVAVVSSPKHAPRGGAFFRDALEKAAAAMGLKAVAVHVENAAELESGLAVFARESQGAMVMMPDAITLQLRKSVVAQAERHRLPALYPTAIVAREGGIMSYSPDIQGIHRQAAAYVDRILRGARPVDLPVQAPTTFKLVLNRRAARAIGLDLPNSLLMQADEVIE